MTLIEFLIAVCVVANVALQCIVLIEVREIRRWQWPPRVDDATQVRRAVTLDAEDT